MQSDRDVRKEARDLDAIDLEVSKNLKSVHDMEIGARTRYLVAVCESRENLQILKVEFCSCYLILTKYLQTKLPHNSILLRDLMCIHPDERHRSTSAPSIRRTALSIANILKNTKLTSLTPGTYTDQIMTEYKIYQTEDFHIPVPDLEDGPIRIEDY